MPKPNPEDLPFFGARAKLSIGSLDDCELHIHAQYNPAQLDRTKQATWNQHANHGNRTVLEYTGQPPRTMSLELLFDGYEAKQSIEDMVAALEQLATPFETEHHENRPHHCVVTWGTHGIAPFRCVVESVGTKYQMFDRDGVPLRATCSIKLTEIDVTQGPTPCVDDECARSVARYSSETPRDLAGLASRNRNR